VPQLFMFLTLYCRGLPLKTTQYVEWPGTEVPPSVDEIHDLTFIKESNHRHASKVNLLPVCALQL